MTVPFVPVELPRPSGGTVLLRELDAHRVVWTAAAGNQRSATLARRLGFRPEGRRRHAAVHDGRPQDLDGLSLVSDEIDAALAGCLAPPRGRAAHGRPSTTFGLRAPWAGTGRT